MRQLPEKAIIAAMLAVILAGLVMAAWEWVFQP